MPEVEVSVCDAGSRDLDNTVLGQSRWDQTVQDLCVGISGFRAPTSTHLGCKADLVECFDLFAASPLLLSPSVVLKGGNGTGSVAQLLTGYCPCPITAPGVIGCWPWTRCFSRACPRPWGLLAKPLWCSFILFCFSSLIQYPESDALLWS